MGRPKGNWILDQDLVDEAIRLRSDERKTCHETARILGISDSQVYYIMKVTGNQGKWHNGKPGRPFTSKGNQGRESFQKLLLRAIREEGVVTIEDGLNGGFLVAVGDDFMSSEEPTLDKALRSALGVSRAC